MKQKRQKACLPVSWDGAILTCAQEITKAVKEFWTRTWNYQETPDYEQKVKDVGRTIAKEIGKVDVCWARPTDEEMHKTFKRARGSGARDGWLGADSRAQQNDTTLGRSRQDATRAETN